MPRLTHVSNQDAFGKYSLYNVTSGTFDYTMTCADTVYYQTLLKDAARIARPAPAHGHASTHRPLHVDVNMELFSRRNTVPMSTIAGDPREHARRQCCYAEHNLTLGPSWDVGHWYRSGFKEWDPNGTASSA